MAREAMGIFGKSEEREPLYRKVMRGRSERDVKIAHLSHTLAAKDQELEDANMRAATDALTELPNRGTFLPILDAALARMQRHGDKAKPLSVVFMDLDRFKNVNDSFGHDAGDAVLRQVGKLIKNGIRTGDSAARYGGEEFVILFEETSEAEASKRATHLLELTRTVKVPGAPEGYVLTASFGIASTTSNISDSSQALIKRADKALYAAKEGGRNRVVLASQIPPNDTA